MTADIKEEFSGQPEEIGGMPYIRILPTETKTKRQFEVKSFEIVATEWGKRWDYTLCDDTDEYLLSSWNIASRKKFKPDDLIGKTIKISPLSEKKVLLEL